MLKRREQKEGRTSAFEAEIKNFERWIHKTDYKERMQSEAIKRKEEKKKGGERGKNK